MTPAPGGVAGRPGACYTYLQNLGANWIRPGRLK
jgi:hypothetical protein